MGGGWVGGWGWPWERVPPVPQSPSSTPTVGRGGEGEDPAPSLDPSLPVPAPLRTGTIVLSAHRSMRGPVGPQNPHPANQDPPSRALDLLRGGPGEQGRGVGRDQMSEPPLAQPNSLVCITPVRCVRAELGVWFGLQARSVSFKRRPGKPSAQLPVGRV